MDSWTVTLEIWNFDNPDEVWKKEYTVSADSRSWAIEQAIEKCKTDSNGITYETSYRVSETHCDES